MKFYSLTSVCLGGGAAVVVAVVVVVLDEVVEAVVVVVVVVVVVEGVKSEQIFFPLRLTLSLPVSSEENLIWKRDGGERATWPIFCNKERLKDLHFTRKGILGMASRNFPPH